MISRIHQENQRIQVVFDRSKDLPDDDIIRSHWAKYLSILSAGYLENCIKIVLGEYCRRCSNSQVSSYSESCLERFQNPSAEKIVTLISSFDRGWAENLEEYWRDEKRDAISSIMNIRHHAAHGGHFGTTIAQISQYFSLAKDVIGFLHNKILGKQ